MKKTNRPNTCKICGVKEDGISKSLEICVNCIRDRSKDSSRFINKAHSSSREFYGLRTTPPKSSGGVKCNICSNECIIGDGEKGFCGLREVKDGKLFSLTNANEGLMHSYKDPHITNCCAAWFIYYWIQTDTSVWNCLQWEIGSTHAHTCASCMCSSFHEHLHV